MFEDAKAVFFISVGFTLIPRSRGNKLVLEFHLKHYIFANNKYFVNNYWSNSMIYKATSVCNILRKIERTYFYY